MFVRFAGNEIQYSVVAAFEQFEDARDVFTYLQQARNYSGHGIFIGEVEVQVRYHTALAIHYNSAC